VGRYETTPAWRPWLTAVLLLLAAAGQQGLIAGTIYGWCGAQPDLLLTVTLCIALLSDPQIGAFLGFASGLLTASLVGQTVGTYLMSYTLAGYLAGRFTARLFQANAFVVVLGVLAASAAAHVLHGLAAPSHLSLAFWVRTTLGGALWNAVLSLPISAILRRSGWGSTY